MTAKLYMDHHVPAAITHGLRLRNIDVLTAFEDGASEWSDDDLLNRADELERLIFTQDDDFLVLAANRQRSGTPFTGIVYTRQKQIGIGQCIDDLQIVAETGEWEDYANTVLYLPL